MEQVKPEQIKRLLNEGTPQSSGIVTVRASYAASVTDQLNLYFAGNPVRPVDDDFDLMVESWTLTLQDLVPEHRLPEVFIHARQNHATTFVLDVSEICSAWNQMKTAERALRPMER